MNSKKEYVNLVEELFLQTEIILLPNAVLENVEINYGQKIIQRNQS